MVGISAANYRKAILVPGIRKLSGLTVETKDYVPYLNYFLQMFHTDDFQKARASHEAGDPEKDRFLDWMDAAPSFTADDPEYGRESLFFDVIAFDILTRETMEQVDLEIACAEILEDGKITISEFMTFARKHDVEISLAELPEYLRKAKELGLIN